MKQMVMVFFFVGVMAGCTSHYQEIRDDNLVFFLEKSGAQSVKIACSLDSFLPREAMKLDGRWVVFLPVEDQFRYYYVVDGKLFVPPCPMREMDDFGSENCVFDLAVH